MVISEPDGVTHHMFFSPAQGETDALGELRIEVQIGDKPGKYVALFFPQQASERSRTYAKYEVMAQESNWPTMLILSLAGGLAIFLYGMKLASDGLQAYAGNRLRSALADLTRNRMLGFLLGIVVTFFTQSSGATTVMLMSFVRAKLLSFRNSLGVVLGAAVGGTITVYLISFNLFAYALPGIACGFVIYFAAKKSKMQAVGLTILGFGMVFLGLRIMTEQMSPLKAFPFFREAVQDLGDHPVWAIILSTLFTMASQNSGATLGIVMSLARQDLMTLHGAIPIFFGASIGSCFAGITGSFGAPVEAKRIAWAHFIYKVGGALIFLPMIGYLDHIGQDLTGTFYSGLTRGGDFTARAIANTYTLFIVVTAVATLPLIPWLESLTKRLVPDTPDYASGEMRTKYLDLQILDTPSIALGSARREISRMGRFVEEMMKHIMLALMEKDEKVLEFIRQRDNKVDRLNSEITQYLTNLTKRIDNEIDSSRAMELLYIVSDLESIGDIVDKNLIPLVEKMIVHDYNFSDEGKTDLKALHLKVSEQLSAMVIALTTDDSDLADSIISNFEFLQNEGERLHLRHLQRLQNGLRESIETSSVHLDVINYLLRIDYLIFNISLRIAGKGRPPLIVKVS